MHVGSCLAFLLHANHDAVNTKFLECLVTPTEVETVTSTVCERSSARLCICCGSNVIFLCFGYGNLMIISLKQRK